MTDELYREDAYLREATATVIAHVDGALILDRSLFYPAGGGQPGDTGRLTWQDGSLTVISTARGSDGAIALMPDTGSALPPAGAEVVQHLDWERRCGHMRVHTALHLLSVVIPLPVTGGAIAEGKGRLDFDMAEPPEDRNALEAALNALAVRNLAVTQDWISEQELDRNPGLVKTMSVQPPRGAGRIRLVRIGQGAEEVDLQPCGGTHVARTGEIGPIRLGKIEKKGAQNRRVYIHLD